MKTQTNVAGRIPALDAMRLAAVLAVVALHAGVAYSTVVPWWYVGDPDKSRLMDVLLAACDGFTMPLLFVVAGYFALPSLARRGVAGFVSGKVWRLVLPLVGLTLFYCPVIAYVDYLDKGGTAGFWARWLALLPSLADWRFLYFPGTQSTAAARDLVWPYHLWFLAMLFLFCLALAAARGVVGPGLARQALGSRAGWGRFGLAALVVGVAAGLGQMSGPDAAWARLGPFLVFQPARVPQNAGFFLLGTYAWKRGLLVAPDALGRAWAWGLGAGLFFGAMLVSGAAARAAGPGMGFPPFFHGLARTGFALAVAGLLAVVLGRARAGSVWRQPGLSAASFDLYLLHFPPVIVLQYCLVGMGLPVAAKFVLCFLVPTAASLALTRLVGRHSLRIPVVVASTFCLCLAVWP